MPENAKPVISEPFVFNEPVLLAWNSLINPRTNHNGGVYYEATFLVPAGHSQLGELSAVLKKVRSAVGAVKKYPIEKGEVFADKLAAHAAAKNRQRNYDWARPYTVLSGRAVPAFPPRLGVYRKGDGATPVEIYVPQPSERATVAGMFYPGVRVVADLSVSGYTSQGGSIVCYMNDVRSLNRGDRIEGIGSKEGRFGPASAFSKYLGEVSDHNPLTGLDDDDDEIPF